MRTELMHIIAYPKPTRVPILVTHECPAGCDLPDMVLCWLRRERELRADLVAARGSDDAEVLRADLRAAESRIDALIALGRRAA
jgi:hypothetical protein